MTFPGVSGLSGVHSGVLKAIAMVRSPLKVSIILLKTQVFGAVAQRLEQQTHNLLVPGSNPGGPIAKPYATMSCVRLSLWLVRGENRRATPVLRWREFPVARWTLRQETPWGRIAPAPRVAWRRRCRSTIGLGRLAWVHQSRVFLFQFCVKPLDTLGVNSVIRLFAFPRQDVIGHFI